ncbi:MAG TPA: TetR/AcrR family transcriptional regulator [Thermoleophilaceae bacterium]|nr:TetR/AcrR family transcriptional regulator [Thermoleophilaceae bacterium]
MATRRAEIRETRRHNRDRIVAAAEELVREGPYGALTVDDVMRKAGIGRTIFYRHFDDLPDLLRQAGREAIDEMFDAQRALADARLGDSEDVIRAAIEPAVAVYRRHGPLLRAISEAAASEEQIDQGQEAMRRRFDELVEDALRAMPGVAANPPADLAETARALNLMNESYLREAFGGEPRVSVETAIQTLTEVWFAVIHRGGNGRV